MFSWCERGELNPHALGALDPKSSASTSSATLALTWIFHKDRREMAESAVNAESERSELFEEQVQKARRHIVKYFEDTFCSCDAAGMVLSVIAADRLLNIWVKH